MAAARGERVKCLAMLIDAGCDIDAEEEGGFTAAMWAARWSAPKCLELLLRSGCALGDVGESGWCGVAAQAGLAYKNKAGRELCMGLVEAEACRRSLLAATGGAESSEPSQRAAPRL